MSKKVTAGIYANADIVGEQSAVINAQTIERWSPEEPDRYIINGALGLQLNCSYTVSYVRINQEIYPLNSLNPNLDCNSAVESLYKKNPVKFYIINGKAIVGSTDQ